MSHWTQELKEENARLKEALEIATQALRLIPQGRFDKYRYAKDTEHSMAYRKAVQEIDLRNLEALARISDALVNPHCSD